MSIQCIIGLGNPGAQYELTRHNIGFWLIDRLARQYQCPLRLEKKFFAELAKSPYTYLAKPMTYMNKSGQAVLALMQFYRWQPEQLLIVHDDIDLSVGKIKIKQGGGHGGHNGLRDIIQKLGGRKDFYRLRIGIGRPQHQSQVVDYVLSRPNAEEEQKLQQTIDRIQSHMDLIYQDEWEKAKNQLHQ